MEKRNRDWALSAAMAADQVGTACERLSHSLLLTDCRSDLQGAFERVRHLEAEVRQAADRQAAEGQAVPQLERLRRQVAVFQALVHHLLAYRADLAALMARCREVGASEAGRVWIEG
ncbi:MAG: hypothetical protein ACKV22_35915 [Bryobacteraceae bacterium]